MGLKVPVLSSEDGFSCQPFPILQMKGRVAQSCLPLCNPMDYTVHGILQAQILAVGSHSLLQGIFPQPRDQAQVSHTAGRFFTC